MNPIIQKSYKKTQKALKKTFDFKRSALVSAATVISIIGSLLSPVLFFGDATAFAAAQSKCEWTQIRQIPGTTNYTHFLNIKYGQTENWCMNTRDSYDTTSQYGTYKAPTYTPAIVPTPSPSPAPSPSSEPSAAPSPEVSPSPTPSLDPTPEPSASPEPSISPSPEPSIAPSPTPEVSPSPEASAEPSPSPEVSPTPSPSTDPTPTPAPIVISGGGNMLTPELDITDEIKTEAKENSIVIKWTTSHPATSRVIYDTVSGMFYSNSNSPTYGFSYIKEGDDSGIEKVVSHSVTLADLVPGITYYYRTVSVGSLVISSEHSFTVPAYAPSAAQEPEVINAPVPSLESGLPAGDPAIETNLVSGPVIEQSSVSANPGIIKPAVISADIEKSIVDYLSSKGQSSDFDHRSRLAGENGIVGYTGTYEQNILLLGLIKKSVPLSTTPEQLPEVVDEEKNKAPENSAVNEAAATSQETGGSEPPINNELQAGLAGVTGENSFISGILNGINQTAVFIAVFIAALILAGKEFWVKMLKKVKE